MVDYLIYEGELHYAIVCKGKPVGCINVSRLSAAYSQTGELSIVLRPDFCGQGLGTEAVRLVVEKAFELCRVRKNKKVPRFETLVAYVVGDNPAAEQVLSVNGFNCVGTQKNAFLKEGKVCDKRVFNLARSSSTSITHQKNPISLKSWTVGEADLYLKMIHKVDFAYQDENLRPQTHKEAADFLAKMLIRADYTDSIYCAVWMNDEVLGHMALVEFEGNGYFGKVRVQKEGRLIYSDYQAALFFMAKGNKNKGNIIRNESDIKSVTIIRKDNKKNALYNEMYSNHQIALQMKNERLDREAQQREEERNHREEERKRIQEEEQRVQEQQLLEASALGDYASLEEEALSFYENSGEPYNENFVKSTIVPMLAKIKHKAIDDIGVYKKYMFDKKNNPRFCKLLEMKTGVKLANTQKKNVEILNQYLKS